MILNRRARRIAVYVVFASAVGYTFAAVFAWWYAGQLLAPVNRTIALPASALPIESASIASESGTNLAAWYVPADNASRTVILLHGIRSSRLAMLKRAAMFHRRGLAVVMIDFQAHGESPGERITLGYLEKHDVRAAVAFARAKNPAHKIVVVGRSLGGAAAVLASPLGVDALIVESMFANVEQAIENRLVRRVGAVGRFVAPLFTWQSQARLGISTDELRPMSCIASAGCPVLIMGGALDRLTTIDETRQLYDAAVEPKELLAFEDAGHEDFFRYDAAGYESAVMRFIDRWAAHAAVEPASR
jgi:uncharacterized protein